MKALWDNQDKEIVAVVDGTIPLKQAVENFLKQAGELDKPGYFHDGEHSMTGREFIASGAYKSEFKFKKMPK